MPARTISRTARPRTTPRHGKVLLPLKQLLPAPPPTSPEPEPRDPPPHIRGRKVSFLDLPAELRIEIYHMVLRRVVIHILPQNAETQPTPHGLLRTCHQIRREVMPIIHTTCSITATVTDFDFTGLLNWLSRLQGDAQVELAKNTGLSIRFCTSDKVPGDLPSLRRWLHDRADAFRPQPRWRYFGPTPNAKAANDLRRRLKRMKEVRKKEELRKIVKALGVPVYDIAALE